MNMPNMDLGLRGIGDQLRKQKEEAKQAADLKKSNKRTIDADKLKMQSRPGYEALEQTEAEKRAGVVPPGWEGLRDIKTGQLLDQYRINPFTGAASQRLQAEALGTGPSQWAQLALGRQAQEEAQARQNAGLQQQTAQSQAQSNLARFGGLGGGARTSLARSGARDALMASQGVGAQGQQARSGIQETDAQRRQQLLGQTADVERGADIANLGSSKEDLAARAAFNANRYNQQMASWGAKQSADATRAAGGGGGKK